MKALDVALRSDVTTLIRQALAAVPDGLELALRFLGVDTKTKRYVVGRNEQAADLLRLVRLDGVIDDYEKNASAWHGVSVVGMKDVPRDALVVNCSTSISPVAVARALRQAGVAHVIGIHELVHAAQGRLPWPWFVRQQREDLEQFFDEWLDLHQSLADAESRATLLDVLRYRATADARYMQAYRVRLRDQYFEDFMALGPEVFVDAGGFDGDTTEEFAKRCPGYRKVHLFEPSLSNIAAARRRLAGLRDIDFHPLGLSDERGQLSFNPDAGSASAVTRAGGVTIEVIKLDEALLEQVTFIKMDLEGWELKALAGSARHIRRERPKLAISVYHAARDFREIFRYVLSLNPAYKVYIKTLHAGLVGNGDVFHLIGGIAEWM